MGITEKEIIDSVMEAHGESIETAKAKATTTAEVKAQKEIDELQGKVTALETAKPIGDDGNEWKEKHNKLKSEFDMYKQTIETAKTATAKQAALEKALLADGANAKMVKLLQKEFDLDKIELDGEKIKGWDELSKPIKAEYSDVFGKVEQKGAGVANPLSPNSGVQNPFMREHFSLQAQTELFRNNPDLAKQYAAQAGIKL